ncbi:MAG: hypothetical protein HXX11_17290 [Desulfuromonadales bacterium]|nr:hypothetical protein [Desulfuromonadales bacterium]
MKKINAVTAMLKRAYLFCMPVARASNKTFAIQNGWKTSEIIATHYNNPHSGDYLGFVFPLNPNNSNRQEILDFMGNHGGYACQGGGYPGAEIFVSFKGVTDRITADKKIKNILPSLGKLIRRL